jgi:hypothetical protein
MAPFVSSLLGRNVASVVSIGAVRNNHRAPRALAPLVALGLTTCLLGACSSNDTTTDGGSSGSSASGSSSSSGSASGSASGAASGSASGAASGSASGSSSGSSSGTPTDGGGMAEAAAACGAPTMNASDKLPFPVDGHFIASGYEGDFGQIKNLGDGTGTACGGSRAPTEGGAPVGNCWAVTYTPLLTGGLGWAGVAWQYPTNNWGASPGYLIPAGATQVVFSAKGKNGGEVASFGVGGVNPSTTSPCGDSVTTSLMNQVLTTTWTQYAIPLNGQPYSAGQIIGFSWSTGVAANVPDAGTGTADAATTDAGASAPDATTASDAAAGDAAAPTGIPISFYIDNIRWQ